MKIIFEGFYGFKNAGDDAFVEVASWGAETFWNCNKNVFIGEKLPETKQKIIANEFGNNLKGFDRLHFIRHFFNSEYLISAGGSTFSDIPFHSNRALAKRYASFNNFLKLGAIGVSIGPFQNTEAEKNVERYLQSLSFLALRDRRSFEYASSLVLPYTPVNAFDLAALLPSVYETESLPKQANSTQKTIGISICNYERYKGGDRAKETHRNRFFKRVVQELLQQEDVFLKVFIINGNDTIGDKDATQELLQGIDAHRYEVVPYSGNVENTWHQIERCDFMLSTRLHAGIFACYAQVPFVLIEYHRKCSDFLTDVGQPEALRVYDAEKDPLLVAHTILNTIEENYEPPKNLLETIARSKRNFTETLKLDML